MPFTITHKPFLKTGIVILTLLPVLLIWGGAEFYLLNHAREEQKEKVEQELSKIRSSLEHHIYSNLLILNSLAAVIKSHPSLEQQEFSRFASALDLNSKIIRNIAMAPDLVIRSIYPVKGNEAAIGLDYQKKKEQWGAVERAIKTRRIQIAGPLQLVQGGSGIIARLAVFTNDNSGTEKLWGIISSVMDSDKLFQLSGVTNPKLNIEIALRDKDAPGGEGKVFLGDKNLLDYVQSSASLVT